MIYTDGVHMVADSLGELHQFAKNIGIKRHRFHGLKKGHPHYDLIDYYLEVLNAIANGAQLVTEREILEISKKSINTSKV